MSRTTQGRGTHQDADGVRAEEAQAEDAQTDDAQSPSLGRASQDQLRAMAHPLRLEIMERVGRRGTARAADLAADLGIPANSVSYHLRILARGGVIEEAPEAARDRRDRVWRLTQVTYSTGRDDDAEGSSQRPDPEYLAASGATSLAVIDWVRTAWVAEIARHGGDAQQEGTGHLFGTSVRLTEEELAELNRVIMETLFAANERHRDERGADLTDPEEGEAPRSYRVLWAAVGEQGTGRRGTGA